MMGLNAAMMIKNVVTIFMLKSIEKSHYEILIPDIGFNDEVDLAKVQ